MPTTVLSNFDALANGTVPTAANTGFGSVFIAGAAVADTALKYQGAASIDGSGAAYFTRLPVNMTRAYDAFYFYPENSPSVITGLVEARSTGPAGAVAFQVQMTTTRTLRIRDSSQAAVATGATVLPINQWSRIEVGANNGAIEVRIYAGTAAVESSTPTEVLSGAYAQTDIDWLSIGQINTATFDWHLDMVRTNPDTWVGPLVATSPPVNTVAPTISGDGTPIVGETLTSTLGTWTGTPTPTLTRQWKRDGANISGATGATHTPTTAGSYRCDVTGTNTDTGSPVTVESNAITVTTTPGALTGSAATQADTATIKVADPANGTAPYAHAIAQLSGPATTARVVGTTGRWWAVERQTEATTWRITTTDAAGSTALARDITVDPPSTGTSGAIAYYGTPTGWV